MNKKKLFASLVLAFSILLVQVGGVLAAPVRQDSTGVAGTIRSITLESDPATGVTTVAVELAIDDQTTQTVRVSLQTAEGLGLITLDADGNPAINDAALGTETEVSQSMILADEELDRHPVGNALATFFAEITDYKTIMEAHNEGVGFGIIAQALWLTMKLQGDSSTFTDLIHAKQTGDYSAFTMNGDENAPKSWGQLRKEILNGAKIGNLGSVMSDKKSKGHADEQPNPDKPKDNKKDKGNPANNNGNGNGKGNNKNK